MTPNPNLPDSVALALRAAALPVPALLCTIGHDLHFQSAVGQLLPLVVKQGPLVGVHVMDRPVPKGVKRIVLHHVLRALLGTPQRYTVTAHGRRWSTTLEPIPDPTEVGRVLGVLGTFVLAGVTALAEPDDDLLGAYQAQATAGGVHRGDVVTVRRTGAMRHVRLALQSFDHLLALGVLTPCALAGGPSPDVAAPRRRSAGASGRPWLHLA